MEHRDNQSAETQQIEDMGSKILAVKMRGGEKGEGVTYAGRMEKPMPSMDLLSISASVRSPSGIELCEALVVL